MDRAVVRLMGNVGQIKSQYTDNGKRVTEFSVAVNRGKGDNKETDWYQAVAWDKTAEMIGEMVEKGTRVQIVGRQAIKTYAKKDGSQGFSVEITVNDFDVLAKGKKKDEDQTYQ